MKRIGFLSFGHWTPAPQSGTRSASDALLQSIDLAVAAEELGADGAYFRVHHSARPPPPRALFRGLAGADLVGRGLRRHRRLGRGTGHEPAKLYAQERRDRRALSYPAGQANPRLPRRLEGGGTFAPASHFRQPQ